jgi:hypothetical protein
MLKRALLPCMFFTIAYAGGCGSSGSKSEANAKDGAAPLSEYKGAPIPPQSPFAKLTVGMGSKQVSDLIGPPTDQDGRMTGKNFNPFYYGNDRFRTTWYYKGHGKLIFSSQSRLLEIQYNPEATGYR